MSSILYLNEDCWVVKVSSLSFQGVQNANLEIARFVVCSNGHGGGCCGEIWKCQEMFSKF